MQLPRPPLLVAATASLAALLGGGAQAAPEAAAAAAADAAAAAAVAAAAASSTATTTTSTTLTMPCTATSTSGAFYDLRPDIVRAPAEGAKKPKAGVQTTDYLARGHDYGANFTLNICAAVVRPVANVAGVDRDLWANVSAYYERDGSLFSLGQQSSTLISRGRELVLQYTGGSPCPELETSSSSAAYGSEDKRAAGAAAGAATARTLRRKSATFAFLCDRDPLETTAHVSFVGTPDECAYFFKIRSPHACAGAEPHKPGSVGPGGVFAIILGVALLVYFIGGVVYQRTVAHARGWRQLPNHTLWLGIWSFVRDFFIILTSSCGRLLPRRQGYRTLSTSPTGRSREDENRLIDQLDEEWD